MYEEEVVVISSSPEPEPVVPSRSNKQKARATNVRLEAPNPHHVTVHSTPSVEDTQPVASGSGSRRTVEVETPEDPVEVAVQQVLDVIPNVERSHLYSLVARYMASNCQDVGTMIISHLLEHPDYPKAGKRKSEAVVAAASSSKRAKIDYLAEGREPITDTSYISVALMKEPNSKSVSRMVQVLNAGAALEIILSYATS
ncbi:hypothetical protein BN14_03563 [Rhizoctonia solani AG-1 IB]|uniref:Uncharacterized protein n=1 Tax=Thanatephorus cucumeris (strain AG1-IB / isolate 7/3/14) TaxID=1108050 RepID=M5C104_THACB|nr:hypothetical protein BN14_03563 [Rhizoctonia solani AG-1 IB]